MMISVMWEVWEHRLLTAITQNKRIKKKKKPKTEEGGLQIFNHGLGETELQRKRYSAAV
jgi:hypothetical protein